ncbi:MAG: tRNA preQ1(34) S-adenosylmethionine ribosyltransferase-isomerase QueA [Chloroflexota bacterium]|nr:tRNA preQ1(34) S-adenosylmethionine ribosyltransferase-isomerase QueA [Chloroflexota bacterium]
MLREHDLVVLNNTRVIPARLRGRRKSGGAVEVLLLNRTDDSGLLWKALARPARKLTPGTVIDLVARDSSDSGWAEILGRFEEGEVELRLSGNVVADLGQFGEVPLPPYIRSYGGDPERYQTVFAQIEGSAAAPTAGLHLTPEMLSEIEVRGARVAYVTLQIGLDTFRPVTVERVAEHKMHAEWCAVPAETAHRIAECKSAGGRVVAIGTTSARTLESWGQLDAEQRAAGYHGWTSIFITPGYRWTTVDAMLTNFHLPKSTLLMMISSFAGRELTRHAYMHAVQQRYRFFSFGDAMVIV